MFVTPTQAILQSYNISMVHMINIKPDMLDGIFVTSVKMPTENVWKG